MSKKLAGWLTPKGEFIECNIYEHIDAVSEHPVFTQTVPKIQEILDNLDEEAAACQRIADRDGSHNAEWHTYEMACDDAKSEIWRLLLDHGFIRVGESDGNLHFEGRPRRLKSNAQICRDFADSFGAGCVFEPQRRRDF